MLALRCPSCGEALPVRSAQRIFVCAACGRTCTTRACSSGGLQPLPRILVQPQQPWGADEALYLLPVWVINGPDSREVRVPALGTDRMTLLLSLAERLTAIHEVWQEWEIGRDLPRAGADLHAEEAHVIAELLCRHEAGGESSAEPRFGGLRLLDWPCVRRSSQLLELVGGRAASARLLADLAPVAMGPSLNPVSIVQAT